jgi:hypothetical protein
MNGGIEVAEALRSLARLEALGTASRMARFACTDSTPSRLCDDPRRIGRELARLPAWAVMRRGGDIVLWLGTPGQVVTEVRFDPAQPDQVAVSRQVPPPA